MESLTGMWVNFFTAAGIPSDVGATYAITFTENRIQNDMLLDLNKEYLRDMGISRMGDVIAILRHAKLVHENTARERVLNTTSPAPVPRVPVAAVTAQSQPGRAAFAALPKPTSPVSRILGHYTRNPPPPDTPAAPVASPRPRGNISIKRRIAEASGSSIDAKKVRLIEIKSNTETRTVPGPKKNVFSRLGGASESSKAELVNDEPEQKNIFSRLGNKSVAVNVGVTQQSVQQYGGHQALQYEGILKSQPELKKVAFSSVQQTAIRKSVSIGTMRADEAPISVKEKLTVPKAKTVKFSSHIDYKEIECVPKKKIFFQSVNTEFSKPASENSVFNKPERRLTMPSDSNTARGGASVGGAQVVKSRLGSRAPASAPSNVFTRLGQP